MNRTHLPLTRWAALLALWLSLCLPAHACPDIDGLADLNCDGKLLIVCFGDSITAGEGDTAGLGYPGRLQRTYLPNPSVPNEVVVVANRGVGGERTSTGLGRLGRVLTQNYPDADYVFILEGVNDSFASNASVSHSANDLFSMVRTAQNSGAVPLLSRLTDSRLRPQHSYIVSLNNAIRNSARVDLFSLGTGILGGDGLHPTGAGYDQVASRIIVALKAASDANRPVDTDGDGLSDLEEQKFGTDPTKTDTDGDGLSDYEEVVLYHSNPLVADSDGDGVPDGVEVQRHTDPNSNLPVAPVVTKLEPMVVGP